MTKKIKSFTVDEEAYNALGAMFKESGAASNISSCLDKHIKELVEYFKAYEEELRASSDFTVKMSFIIDSFLSGRVMDRLKKDASGNPDREKIRVDLAESQQAYDEATRQNLRLNLESGVYGKEFSEAVSKYGASDVVNFIFKVLMTQAKKGRELTANEYEAIEASMGEGFAKYRLERVKPKVQKIDDGLDKLLKVFGLKVDRSE